MKENLLSKHICQIFMVLTSFMILFSSNCSLEALQCPYLRRMQEQAAKAESANSNETQLTQKVESKFKGMAVKPKGTRVQKGCRDKLKSKGSDGRERKIGKKSMSGKNSVCRYCDRLYFIL